jgi:hypothetical protein
MASATGLAALHSPLEDGSLAEIVQLLELLAELGKALGVAIASGGRSGVRGHKKGLAKSSFLL